MKHRSFDVQLLFHAEVEGCVITVRSNGCSGRKVTQACPSLISLLDFHLGFFCMAIKRGTFRHSSRLEGLEQRVLLAADVLVSHEPAADIPGYTTYLFEIESTEPVLEINARIRSGAVRQVNSRHVDSIFQDNNDLLGAGRESIAVDSQFLFHSEDDDLSIVKSRESRRELSAQFTGFTPFHQREVAQVTVKNTGATSYSFEITTAIGTETIEQELASRCDGILARQGNQWSLARLTGKRLRTQKWSTTDADLEWLGAADVDADGVDELVGRNTVSGEWIVSRSSKGARSQEVWGQWSTGVEWVDVNLADINGDGCQDVIGRVAHNGSWWAAVSTGNGFQNQPRGRWAANVDWSDVRVGDMNGDGRDDVVGRVESNGSIWVGLSTDFGFSSRVWGHWRTDADWGFVEVGDADGDGRDDLIGRNYNNGGWMVGRSTGSRFISHGWGKWSRFQPWVDFQLADLNGDGRIDIVARLKHNGHWFALESQGDHFTTSRRGRWSSRVDWVDVKIADLNGDGRDDILGRNRKNGKWTAAISNGKTLNNVNLGRWSGKWADTLVGRF